jgi:integrase
VTGTAGDELLRDIDEEAIRDGRERRAAAPHAANNFLKAMCAFFAWAVDEGLLEINPTAKVKLLKGPNDDVGFHTWTEEELQRFEARWPVGTRERLAFDLLLYTGLRRGDVVRLGRQHVRDGMLSLRMEKTGDMVVIPMLPILQATIDASAVGDLTYLITEFGNPFSKAGFGNWFRRACRKAKCPGSAHGLRKAGATRAAENGATERQLMAIFGWTSSKMATHYTRAAEQRHLAMSAGELLLPARKSNGERPHPQSGAGENPEKQASGKG